MASGRTRKRGAEELTKTVEKKQRSSKAEDFETLNFVQLKDQCRQRGLKVGGTKAQLLERLNSSASRAAENEKSRQARATEISSLKLAGASADDIANTDAVTLRKSLNAFVCTYSEMVDLDWQDGFEEQAMELHNWVKRVSQSYQSVFNLAIKKKIGYSRCHEVLMVVSDTRNCIESVPARIAASSNLEMDSFKINTDPQELLLPVEGGISMMWRLFLASAASSTNVNEKSLHRWIKDALDNGVEITQRIIDGDDKAVLKVTAPYSRGYEKVKNIFTNHKKKLSNLPVLVKQYKKRKRLERIVATEKVFSESESER